LINALTERELSGMDSHTALIVESQTLAKKWFLPSGKYSSHVA